MKKITLLLLLALSFISTAQNPGDIAKNFGIMPGFDNAVYQTAIQPDGKILVGGGFMIYKGLTENFLIRLNPDGSKDNSFVTGTGFSDPPTSIVLQDDGKILVGGLFLEYNGLVENRIIRLNADGSKDISFVTGTGFNDSVNSIVLQADGKILVVGDFTEYKGVTENRIIRLNADGSKDNSFVTGTGFNGSVRSVAQQADGKILLGGNFTAYKGVTENRIIRLNVDGSKDTSFVTGTGFNGFVDSIAQQTDSKILLGGNFTAYKGVTENRIVRLNVDGSKDTSFVTGTGFNGFVGSIVQQADSKILLGGNFTTYKGVTENSIIRLNTDGSKDASFVTEAGLYDAVYSISLQTDGKIILGFDFITFQGVAAGNRIIRINDVGSEDTSFVAGTGLSGAVMSITQQADGKMLLVGDFSTYKGGLVNGIIRLNVDGSKDASFVTGSGFNGYIWSIVLQADGKILVGGSFTIYNGVPENKIIRLNADGSRDASFVTGTAFNGTVASIVQQADGKILVGGAFTTYKGVTENKIIRLNADGSRDASFVTGVGFNSTNSAVWSIVLQADGKILVGGSFTAYKGVSENRIIRLNADGSRDNSFVTGTGFNQTVVSIVEQVDGKILVGGGFTTYKDVTENSIIRLNADGSKDSAFVTGTGFNVDVTSIVEQVDGKILVGGGFTTYKDVTENYLIRLNANGSKDTSFITGIGFNDAVYKIAQKTDGKILVGGNFTTYQGGAESAYLIELHADNLLNSESFSIGTAVLLWPNPAKDVLNIKLADYSKVIGAKVYDLQGKLIFEKTSNSIDVSHLSPGLYLIKIANKKGEFTEKFIKE